MTCKYLQKNNFLLKIPLPDLNSPLGSLHFEHIVLPPHWSSLSFAHSCHLSSLIAATSSTQPLQPGKDSWCECSVISQFR